MQKTLEHEMEPGYMLTVTYTEILVTPFIATPGGLPLRMAPALVSFFRNSHCSGFGLGFRAYGHGG